MSFEVREARSMQYGEAEADQFSTLYDASLVFIVIDSLLLVARGVVSAGGDGDGLKPIKLAQGIVSDLPFFIMTACESTRDPGKGMTSVSIILASPAATRPPNPTSIVQTDSTDSTETQASTSHQRTPIRTTLCQLQLPGPVLSSITGTTND